MKIKISEQILQLFDDRRAHSGSNKKTQAVHTILDTIKRKSSGPSAMQQWVELFLLLRYHYDTDCQELS